MDKDRIAHIRRTLEATTAPPDVCMAWRFISIVSGPTPQQVQLDAQFYRQAWFFVRDLLDEVDQLQAACTLAIAAAERCQEKRNGDGPAMRDGISGFADG